MGTGTFRRDFRAPGRLDIGTRESERVWRCLRETGTAKEVAGKSYSPN